MTVLLKVHCICPQPNINSWNSTYELEINDIEQESRLKCYGHEKRRRRCGQDSDGDGCAGEEMERKSEAEVDGQH